MALAAASENPLYSNPRRWVEYLVSLRGLFVVAVVLASLPIILFRPDVGILVWAWLGFMNPHRLAWGFVQEFPFAQIVAITTAVGMIVSGRWKFAPLTRETALLGFFVFWMQVTTFLALNQKEAWEQWDKVLKIQLMILVTLMVIRTTAQLRALVWVVVASIGFYGVKGGLFTVILGGEERVYGPEGTFIEGNNEIGMAMIMILPLARYLQQTTPFRWLRYPLLGVMFLSVVAIVGTHSRGALLGLITISCMLLWKSRRRVSLALGIAVLVVFALSIMPEKWFERMETIRNYEQDNSAMSRLHSWRFATRLARDRPVVGGGFEAFTPEHFARYGFDPDRAADAHSIYFEVLGEQGFVGLLLFLALGVSTWFSCSSTARSALQATDEGALGNLVRMVQVSLAGYAVSGAFLGLAYFDLFYNLIAFAVIARSLVAERQESFSPEPLPRGELAPRRLERPS
jgi:probable O-glycosylation ligase (exosortase A-associated)